VDVHAGGQIMRRSQTPSALLEVGAKCVRQGARPAVNGEASGCPAQAPGRHSRKSWSLQVWQKRS
jgi:hypothetical protein